MTSTGQQEDVWSYGYLIDNIFNDLMDANLSQQQEEADKDDKDKPKRINKYIMQARNKFNFIRLKSPDVKFSIYRQDIKENTKKDLDKYIKDCIIVEKANIKLNGIISEVIAQIYKEAEPLILSSIKYEDPQWVRKSINTIRSSVSKNWEL